MCGDAQVTKKLSAPRLNLAHVREPADTKPQAVVAGAGSEDLQAAWMALARKVLAQTEDVGTRFAEEARRIHYGETEARDIRGSALKVAESLLAGRVCVSTEAGARGYGADAGPGLVRVADVAAMGDAIGALLRDRTRRHGIEAAAVDVRRRLGWTHSVDALCAVYRELGLKNDVAESGHG